MNYPQFFRRLAVAAVGVLLFALVPASVMADTATTSISLAWVGHCGHTPDCDRHSPPVDRQHCRRGYTGTVHFSSATDGRISAGSGLPADYTFTGTGIRPTAFTPSPTPSPSRQLAA